ncbi:hypothetical protein PG990_014253 [Apiospora arundinis]
MEGSGQGSSSGQTNGKKNSEAGSISDPMRRYLSESPKNDPWTALRILEGSSTSKTLKKKASQGRDKQKANQI